MGVAALAGVAAVANYRVAEDYLVQVAAERASVVAVARHLAGERPCLVVTTAQPEVGWYSGCATEGFVDLNHSPLPADEPAHLVLFARDRGRLTPTRLRQLAADRVLDTTDLPTGGSLGTARIITLRPAAEGPPPPEDRSASTTGLRAPEERRPRQ